MDVKQFEKEVRAAMGKYNDDAVPVERLVRAVVHACTKFEQWTSEYGCPWGDYGFCPNLEDLKKEYAEDCPDDPELMDFCPHDECNGQIVEGECYAQYYIRQSLLINTPKTIIDNQQSIDT